jgi:hypothetical protein
MPEWIPMFAMPNVQPQYPIESDGIAFVSVFDDRTKALRVIDRSPFGYDWFVPRQFRSPDTQTAPAHRDYMRHCAT